MTREPFARAATRAARGADIADELFEAGQAALYGALAAAKADGNTLEPGAVAEMLEGIARATVATLDVDDLWVVDEALGFAQLFDYRVLGPAEDLTAAYLGQLRDVLVESLRVELEEWLEREPTLREPSADLAPRSRLSPLAAPPAPAVARPQAEAEHDVPE